MLNKMIRALQLATMSSQDRKMCRLSEAKKELSMQMWQADNLAGNPNEYLPAINKMSAEEIYARLK